MKIAIQGQDGSYHSVAARGIFGDDIELIDGKIFGGVFDLVNSGEVGYGVVAIENSIFGTIRSVYDLLSENNLSIVGEAYVKLEHVLAGSKDSSLDDIKTIESQSEAIAACGKWLKGNLSSVKIIRTRDTAQSLQNISEANDRSRAAIGSKSAAKNLGLNILAEDIADNSDTDTRFIVIAKAPNSSEHTDKASILLSVPKQSKGSLVENLKVISDAGINMTKIESRPDPAEKWTYMFYVDLEIDNQKALQSVVSELESLGSVVKVLGVYKSSSNILSVD